MKKIINGKKYDTETAKFLIRYSSSYPVNDFHFWEEELYVKKTGEFFLYGEGGPASKYSKSCGMNSWSGGKEIIPLTIEEAKKWVENYFDADDYEEIFGEVEE